MQDLNSSAFLQHRGRAGYSHTLAIQGCAAGEGMVFKPFGLVKGMVFQTIWSGRGSRIIENWSSIGSRLTGSLTQD